MLSCVILIKAQYKVININSTLTSCNIKVMKTSVILIFYHSETGYSEYKYFNVSYFKYILTRFFLNLYLNWLILDEVVIVTGLFLTWKLEVVAAQ